MKLIFQASCTPYGLLISKTTRSMWTHVIVAFDDGTTYQARAGKGVFKSTVDAAISGMKWTYAYRIDEVVGANEEEARKFCEAQLGKTYDYLSLLNFVWPFKVSLNVESKWVCSEYASAASGAGGVPLLRQKDFLLTPGELALSPMLKEVTPTTARGWKEVLKGLFPS